MAKQNITKWDALSMKDRASFIRVGIKNGITDLEEIREEYNKYADGGGFFDGLETKIANSKFGKFLYKAGILPKNYYNDNTEKKSEITTDSKQNPVLYNLSRKRPNDARTTAIESEALEEDIAKRQASLLEIAEKKGYLSNEYYIPYLLDQEIKTSVGRVSKNILDSLAINAEKAGIPISEAIGLAAQETHFGTAPNISLQGMVARFKKDSLRNPTQREKAHMERVIGNASYARSRGGIYPQFLVNDHEWHVRGAGPSQVKKYKLNEIKSPLEHAFTLYKAGLYNPGESTHTEKVKTLGENLINNDSAIKLWYSEYLEKKRKK